MITVTSKELRNCVAANVRARRLEKNLTQKALAVLAGVTAPHIVQIEAGKTSPSIDLLAKLGKALDTEPHAFLSPGIFSAVDA
jgi:transcriptional regulator with XRE-family HTH domain